MVPSVWLHWPACAAEWPYLGSARWMVICLLECAYMHGCSDVAKGSASIGSNATHVYQCPTLDATPRSKKTTKFVIALI